MALAVDAFVIIAAVGLVFIIARRIRAAVVTSAGEHRSGSLKHGFHSSPPLDITNILTFEDFVEGIGSEDFCFICLQVFLQPLTMDSLFRGNDRGNEQVVLSGVKGELKHTPLASIHGSTPLTMTRL